MAIEKIVQQQIEYFYQRINKRKISIFESHRYSDLSCGN
ncbi:hypothetical protein QFZ28_003290 [Neobacillus niacini]|nr:hypothetical protein [Neobacillus niacini]